MAYQGCFCVTTFYLLLRYGYKIGSNPWWVLLGCAILSGLCGLGLIRYRSENNPFKLWIPSGSDFVKNNEWLEENFPPDVRYNNVIIAGENLLTPDVLRQVRGKNRTNFDLESINEF